MRAPRWFASPLAGTAGVLVGLSLMAIPLHRLTSAQPVAAVQAAKAAVSTKDIPAVLRLKLLVPATSVTLKSEDGRVLLALDHPAAGESEHDAVIPFVEGAVDLSLQADFGDAPGETAVFLTVMPDGYEDQTRYVIGTGVTGDSLHFEWHAH